tara:strand:- start:242 stop:715 length:474 start_codon:yes stop_codon:yes gene_type:complete
LTYGAVIEKVTIMNARMKIKLLLPLLFLLASCATGQLYQDVVIKDVSDNEGRIYFYRNKAAGFGSGIRPPINVDGVTVGRAISGGFFYIDRPQGAYNISVKSDLQEKVITINLKQGETYYVQLKTRMGLMTGRILPELVDSSKGQLEIQSCKLDNGL